MHNYLPSKVLKKLSASSESVSEKCLFEHRAVQDTESQFDYLSVPALHLELYVREPCVVCRKQEAPQYGKSLTERHFTQQYREQFAKIDDKQSDESLVYLYTEHLIPLFFGIAYGGMKQWQHVCEGPLTEKPQTHMVWSCCRSEPVVGAHTHKINTVILD